MLSFSILLFFSFSFLVSTPSLFPDEWRQEVKLRLNLPQPHALLSFLFLPFCICLSQCIPHLFISSPLFTCSISFCQLLSLPPLLSLLSTAHKTQKRKLNKDRNVFRRVGLNKRRLLIMFLHWPASVPGVIKQTANRWRNSKHSISCLFPSLYPVIECFSRKCRPYLGVEP